MIAGKVLVQSYASKIPLEDHATPPDPSSFLNSKYSLVLQAREKEVWMSEEELSPRAMKLWMEWRSTVKRKAQVDEIRRREMVRQRKVEKKRGGFRLSCASTIAKPGIWTFGFGSLCRTRARALLFFPSGFD